MEKSAPIAKVSQQKELKHLRPISILSVFSKMFERHLYHQIEIFSKENKIILEESQSGFRKNYSTATAFLNVISQTKRKEIAPV